MIDEEDSAPPLKSAHVVRILARLHGQPRRAIAQFVVAGTIAGLLEAVSLVLFTAGALRVTGNEAAANLGPVSLDTSPGTMLLAAAVAIILAGAVHAIQARLAADASLRILQNSRHQVAAAFLRSSWTTQSELRDGLFSHSMFQLCSQCSSAASFAATVFNGIVIMSALTVAAFVIAPVFSGILIATIVPIVVMLRPLTKRAQRRARTGIRSSTGLAEFVSATELMAFDIRAFGVADAQLAEIDERNRETAAMTRSARFASRLAAFWFKDLALLVFIITVGVIDILWDLGQPAAAAAILLVIRTVGYAQQGYSAYQTVVEASPGIAELEDRLDRMSSAVEPGGDRPVTSIGRVVFDSVSYTYPNGRVALRDVSFEIGPGRVLGIVGRSGAGKSTIAELLLRMRSPTSGAMLVDGVDERELSLDDWRQLVTIVPQEPRVMRASIADNITFLRSGYSRADIERAARASQLHADIEQFEDGYDTRLGSSNRGLSGGQRQRLAIARAFISHPNLIVLDEPTSALDRHSEQRLQAVLEGLRDEVTMVIIAHRLSTLDLCDDLLLLERGRVVAFGPRAAVMANEDFFSSLPEHEVDEV